MVRGTVLLCVCYIFDVSFFFVKQKTAYEMRISDWSSDVCSSDLEDLQGEPAEYWWNGLNRFGSLCLIDSAWDLRDAREGTLLLRYAQIGRASCRERVCQYVSTSVFAGSLKKKKTKRCVCMTIYTTKQTMKTSAISKMRLRE